MTPETIPAAAPGLAASTGPRVLAFDVGGTWVKYGIVDAQGRAAVLRPARHAERARRQGAAGAPAGGGRSRWWRATRRPASRSPRWASSTPPRAAWSAPSRPSTGYFGQSPKASFEDAFQRAGGGGERRQLRGAGRRLDGLGRRRAPLPRADAGHRHRRRHRHRRQAVPRRQRRGRRMGLHAGRRQGVGRPRLAARPGRRGRGARGPAAASTPRPCSRRATAATPRWPRVVAAWFGAAGHGPGQPAVRVQPVARDRRRRHHRARPGLPAGAARRDAPAPAARVLPHVRHRARLGRQPGRAAGRGAPVAHATRRRRHAASND